MNAILLRNLNNMRKAASLQSFSEYRQAEAQNPQLSSVTSEGLLLEYETLELRLHPPNVVVDNETYDDMTVITIDSANRPGTLIEVVQCLTELGLSIKKARISSDGGWFVDEFFVSETPKGRVIDPRKLNAIKRVLNVDIDASGPQGPREAQEVCTVFELAGRDRLGLLASVLQLLAVNGCEILSAAVWTFHNRVALVISVMDRHMPISDPVKLNRLQQILYDMLGQVDAVVNNETVRGDIHHERRLHHLLLLEELKSWELQNPPQPEEDPAALASRLLSADDAHSGASPSPLRTSEAGSAALRLSDASSSAAASRRLSEAGGTSAGPGSMVLPPASAPDASSLPPPTLAAAALLAGLNPSAAASAPSALPNVHSVERPASTSGRADGSTSSVSEPANGIAAAVPNGHTVPPPPSPFERLSLPSDRPTISAADRHAQLQTSTTFDRVALTALAGEQVAGPRQTAPGASSIAPAPTATLSSDVLNFSSDPANTARFMRADAKIQHSALLNYWLVTISSKDRNKLFFDTVCTLADMNYDVYHGTIDSEGDSASQLFYVRPRYGECIWDEKRANKLKYMLESAVQRRFPKGLKVHVQTSDRTCLADIFQTLSKAGFWITRAEVRSSGDSASYSFSLTDQRGQIPNHALVQRVCESVGGMLVEDLDIMAPEAGHHGVAAATLGKSAAAHASGAFKFSFSFLERRWNKAWGGAGGSSSSASLAGSM